MINHIQTLLANVSSEDAKRLGLSFAVDAAFTPRNFPQNLDKVRLDLVGNDLDSSILAALRIISRLDLSKYLGMYDSRLDTRRKDDGPVVVFSGNSVDFSKFKSQDNVNYLFSKTWNKDTDQLLDELYGVLKNDVDGYNGLAAMILALVVRLDRFNG